MRPAFIEIKEMPRKSRPVRRHIVQSVQFPKIRKSPGQMKDSDFGNRQIVTYRNRQTNEAGISVKIDGKTVYMQGTEV